MKMMMIIIIVGDGGASAGNSLANFCPCFNNDYGADDRETKADFRNKLHYESVI